MIHRRLIALCSGLSILHLTLVVGDPSCASHGIEAASEPSPVHAGARMPHSGEIIAHDHESRDRAPSNSSTDMSCCRDMASCSVVALVSSAAASADRIQPQDRVFLTLSIARHQHYVAPEPPPPKA